MVLQFQPKDDIEKKKLELSELTLSSMIVATVV